MEERLQKFLSRAGVASRRHAEAMIVDGRVKVNGKVVTVLGTRIEPQKDLVLLDGKLVSASTERKYFLFYKPPGVVTTMSDPEGRPTVADYAVDTGGRVFPVGRLDYDAEGALLLTDDGDLANKLMHPSHQVPRVYLAKVKGVPDEPSLAKLVEGVRLEDGMAHAIEARIFEKAQRNTWVKIVVTEGRQHLVKRLCAAIGHPVVRLYRPAHAGLAVQGLMPGALRALTNDEIRRVKAAADGDAQPEPRLSLPARRHGHAAPGFEPEDDEPEPTRPEGRRLIEPPAAPRPEAREEREEPVQLSAPAEVEGEADGEWKPRSRRRSTRALALEQAAAARGGSEGRAAGGKGPGGDAPTAIGRRLGAASGGGERTSGQDQLGGGGKRFGGPQSSGGKRFGGDQSSAGKRFGGEQAAGGDQPSGAKRFGGAQSSGGKRFVGEEASAGKRFGGEQSGGKRFGGDERPGGKRFGGDERPGGKRFGGDERPGGKRFGGDEPGGKRFGGSGSRFGESSGFGGKRAGGQGGRRSEGGDTRFGERSGPRQGGGKFGDRERGDRAPAERPFGASQRSTSGGRLSADSGGGRKFGERPAGGKRFGAAGGRKGGQGQRPIKRGARAGGFKGPGRNSPRKPRGS